MKIDQEDFNRKAQHILDTVVKPQVEKYEQSKKLKTMKLNREDRREEMAGISTMVLLIFVTICAIGATLQVIFNLFKMEDYPKWVNNLVYFLAGIGFGHLLFNFIF